MKAKVVKSSVELVALLTASVAVAGVNPTKSEVSGTSKRTTIDVSRPHKDFRRLKEIKSDDLDLSIYEKSVFFEAREDIRGQ
jgi:hypothetical protein